MKVSGLLRSLTPQSSLSSTIGRINDAFDVLRRILTRNISLTDNIACELYAGYFTHGVPVSIFLRSLSTAHSAIVLSSSIPCIATPQVIGSTNTAQVTLAFARNARRVQVVILLFPEGALPVAQQLALTATATAPGQVIPDNSTIFVDDVGTIYSAGGATGPRVVGEVPSGPTTVTNPGDTYTLVGTPRAGSLAVYVGGLRIPRIDPTLGTARWTLTGSTLQFTKKFVPQPGQGVLVDYDV